MPKVSKIGVLSTGADTFPPSAMIYTPATRTYVDGVLIGLIGAQFAPHTRGSITHAGESRVVVSGSTKTFIEGIGVARVGDLIADGDTISENGASNLSLT